MTRASGSHSPLSPLRRSISSISSIALAGSLSLLGGCGGDHDQGSPGSSPLTTGGRSEEFYARLRHEMVDSLAESIRDRRVLDAMRKVPRHLFVPEEVRGRSYRDVPLPIGEGQTISQPTIVAIMSELLDLDGTEKVLEIGTGSGYQAAVLLELAREVYTVEILPGLSRAAEGTIEELKRRGVLRATEIEFVVGDGSDGYAPAAPYDAIIVTAAPAEVPGALLEQLEAGGRLVIPVGDYYQELKLITKDREGTITEKAMKLVRFVRLVEKE